MKPMRPLQAKILNHTSGLGAPDPDTIRQRARELAQINGRAEINEEDWRQAKRELHGGQSVFSNDADEEIRMVSERDMLAVDLGHHVENIGAEDANNVAEELIAEGMGEALHEQMLQASEWVAAENAEEESEDIGRQL